ncbi:MAG: Adenosylcobinamide-GDP ribazoletransferase [Syntrophomonadaceae bacterium]|nr:Adenosylcobinamide-GDP ribazoletransferase [Bacillota bacterium]
MTYFPLVGLLLGAILILVNLVSSSLFPPLVAKAIVLIVLVILTGALPLGGFVAACEGFFSGKHGDEALTIMRESRPGFRGVVALILLLLIKFALLYSLVERVELGALLLMPLMGRWAMVVIGTLAPYARGISRERFSSSGQDDYRSLVRASLITFIVSLLLFRFFVIPLMAIVCLATLTLRWFSLRKLEGITGDVLRATAELMEIVTLLLFCLIK